MALVMAGSWGSLRAAEVTARTVFFYSPETQINNYNSLKSQFDGYLTTQGAYSFQPFSSKDTFENYVADRRDGVLFLSSWHFQMLRTRLRMEPELVGVLAQKNTQRRILASAKAVTDPEQLRGATVASAGTEEFTRQLLLQMLGENRAELVGSFKILTVPKDIDALLAVGFGVARGAVTAEASLLTLGSINPKQASSLTTVATSREVLLPVVVRPVPADPTIEPLLGILVRMGTTTEGKRLLKMLGLDGIQRLEPAQRGLLEK